MAAPHSELKFVAVVPPSCASNHTADRILNKKASILTCHPHSKGRAFAGDKHRAVGCLTCALARCRGPSCPAGRRSPPIRSAGRYRLCHEPRGTITLLKSRHITICLCKGQVTQK